MDDDPLAGWLADEEEPPTSAGRIKATERAPGRSSRLRRLLVLAGLPWAIVALLALGARLLPESESAAVEGGTSEPSEAGSSPALVTPSTAPELAPRPEPSVSEPSPASKQTGSDARFDLTESGAEDVMRRDVSSPTSAEAAAATLAVRAARTSTGQQADSATSDGPVTYVDHAVAESAVSLPGGVRLISVLAVILEGDGRRWRSTRTVRYAAPLESSPDGPVLAGAVYALPFDEPISADASAGWQTLSDGDKRSAAGAALRKAGYRIEAGLRIQKRPDVPVLRAVFRGVGPNESQTRAQQVWLRDGPRPQLAKPSS
ncbi:MAG: hypothetical protein ACR2MA_08830 [Egibacteraceae bacterium]